MGFTPAVALQDDPMTLPVIESLRSGAQSFEERRSARHFLAVSLGEISPVVQDHRVPVFGWLLSECRPELSLREMHAPEVRASAVIHELDAVLAQGLLLPDFGDDTGDHAGTLVVGHCNQ